MSDFFEASPQEDGVDPEQLMDSIAKWATRHTKLSPEQTAQLKDMLKAHASRLEVFVHIAADQRARMLRTGWYSTHKSAHLKHSSGSCSSRLARPATASRY